MEGNLNFDAEQVEPAGTFEPLPAGWYTMLIKESVVEPNKAGTGKFLKLTLEIVEGPHKGRTLFDRLNMWHPNQQAVDIARATLSAICHAAGRLRVSDSAELHDIPMLGKVTVKPRADTGEPSNEIKGYKALGEAPATGCTPASRPKPAWKR